MKTEVSVELVQKIFDDFFDAILEALGASREALQEAVRDEPRPTTITLPKGVKTVKWGKPGRRPKR